MTCAAQLLGMCVTGVLYSPASVLLLEVRWEGQHEDSLQQLMARGIFAGVKCLACAVIGMYHELRWRGWGSGLESGCAHVSAVLERRSLFVMDASIMYVCF